MKTTINLILFLALAWNTANAQVGIGTTTPNASSILDVESTTKGFMPPRLTTTERGDIISPAVGLTIYNKEVKCLQWYNGTGWFDGCDGSTFVAPILGSDFTNGFQNNNTCTTKLISVTPCSAVSGTTESTVLADGTLYDWTDAGSYMSGGTADALVEIGGQCWFGRNTTTESTYTGTNDFDGYYNNAASEPAVGEGRLYQWSAAMNGSDTERAQGVCPTGWHVPSDCEWMYLENSLGMSTTDQEGFGFRGAEGQKLSTFALAPATNSSGFTALLTGARQTDGTFIRRGDDANWWSSSETTTTEAQSRASFRTEAGVRRLSLNKAFGFSVRCLKDLFI